MAKRAYLLIDHGSRASAANQLINSLASALRERLPGAIVETAHLELARPTIAEGIQACLKSGASELIVHPYFLGPGVHTRKHIPEQVAEALRVYPEVEARISEPLGLHPQLIEIVLERIAEAE